MSKKVLSILLTFLMIMGCLPMGVAASAESSDGLQNGKTYMVPLTRYGEDGKEIDWSASTKDIGKDIIAPYALVTQNADGKYTVVLQWAHYQYFDAIQFYKQGILENGSSIADVKFGTYNIPETFGFTSSLSSTQAKYSFADILKELLLTVTDENENANYIQNFQVSDINTEGFNYLTFELDNLNNWLYFKAVTSGKYSGGRKDATKEANHDAIYEGCKTCLSGGAFSFDIANAKEVVDLSKYTSNNTFLHINRVACIYLDSTGVSSDENATLISSLINTDVESKLDSNGKLTATFSLNSSGDVKVESVREVLNFTAPLTGSYTVVSKNYPQYSTRIYKVEFDELNELLLNDTFSLTYKSAEEAAWGKVVQVTLSDGKYYYAVLGVSAVAENSEETLDALLTPATAAYDKNTATSGLQFMLSANNNTLLSIKNDATALVDGTDYTVEGSMYTISKSYLDKQEIGNLTLTFEMSAGVNPTATISISDSTENTITFTSDNMSFTTEKGNVDESGVFDSNPLTEGEDYEKMSAMLTGHSSKYLIYQPTFVVDGKKRNPKEQIDISMEIPENWDVSNFQLYYLMGTPSEGSLIEITTSGTDYSYAVDGNKCVLSTANLNNTFILAEKGTALSADDIKNLSNGIYSVDIVSWNKDQPTELSMSNVAIDKNSTLLLVKDGKFTVYFDLNRILVSGQPGYAQKLFYTDDAGEKKEFIYFDWVVNEENSSVYNVDYYAKLNGLYYPDSVCATMPTSVLDNGYFEVEFWVPVMDAIQTGDETQAGSGKGSRSALLKFYNVERLSDETALPTYESSFLLKSIEDAERFTKADEATQKMYDVASLEALYNLTVSSRATYQSMLVSPDGQTIYNCSVALENCILNTVNVSLDAMISEAENINSDNYTSEAYSFLQTALTEAKNVYENEAATVSEKNDALKVLYLAIEGDADSVKPDKSQLQSKYDEALTYEEGVYTANTFAELSKAITEANEVLQNSNATKSEIETAIEKLQEAIDGLKTKDSEALDVNNLPDGKYVLYAEMFKTDRVTASMANGAINHNVWLEVINGEYFLSIQFKGLAIYNQFGYLKDLSYYNAGYTYSEYGVPQGTLTAAEVLGVQKDSEGNIVVDQYNTVDTPYPEMLRIKLVDKASAEYIPLQVFVPIMEAISSGTGTQPVLMKLDWSKIAIDDGSIEPDAPIEQSPAVDYTDADTGVKVNADKGVFEADTVIDVTEITSGTDYNNAKTALSDVGTKFKLYNIAFADGEGVEVAPNGTIKLSFPIPAGYDADELFVYRINADGTKTRVNGAVADGYFTVVTRNAGNYALVEAGSTTEDGNNDNQGGTTTTGGEDGGNTNIPETDSPQTGDNSNMALWFTLMLASAAALVVLGFSKKFRFIKEN